jgi:aryl-alcohol dehydrogenase-like predicted oxidoreductase
MKYRILGKTDLMVSEISVGCSGYWGNKNFSEKKATAVIREAFERGINFFDTGHNYSNFNAEPRLGRIVKDILSVNDRSKIIVSTKGGTTIGSATIFQAGKSNGHDYSPNAIENSCLNSIRNLNCDYLDIFQLHGLPDLSKLQPLLERLNSMRRNGMFRYLGVNTHSETDMLYISKNPDLFDMVLIDYNILQLDRDDVIDKLNQAGVGIVAGTVLAQGHLVKGRTSSLITGAYFWYLARALLKPTSRRLARYSSGMREALSSMKEMSAAQAAFAYILENPEISSCVFGTTSTENLSEIIDALDKRLEEKTRDSIRNEFEKIRGKISG